MIRKLGPLALLLMLVAVFAVGCGDDDNGDSSNDTPAVTATAADDTATEEPAPEEDSSADDAVDANLEAGIEACKDSVDSNPAVAANLKEDIKAICDSIKSSDPEEMKRVTREVCETIVKESVPEGNPGRDQALDACAAAGG